MPRKVCKWLPNGLHVFPLRSGFLRPFSAFLILIEKGNDMRQMAAGRDWTWATASLWYVLYGTSHQGAPGLNMAMSERRFVYDPCVLFVTNCWKSWLNWVGCVSVLHGCVCLLCEENKAAKSNHHHRTLTTAIGINVSPRRPWECVWLLSNPRVQSVSL